MTIGCATYSLHRMFNDGRMDLLRFPQTCAELGISEIEINNMFLESNSVEYLKEIKSKVESAGCSVVCLTLDGLNFLSTRAELRDESMKKLKKYFKIANFLGVGIMRIDPGHTSADDGATRRAIDGFKKAIPDVVKHGIKMVIENHWGITMNPDNMVRIIGETGLQYLGSCPDTGNFPEDDLYTGLARIAPFASHVHFKTHQFTRGGEDTKKDFKKIMGIFRKAKYSGCFAIEFEGKFDENCKNEIEGAKRTLELARRYAY